MIHVKSCFYFLNLPTGSLFIAAFCLVNQVLWLSINVGKYMSPVGRHLLFGTPTSCSCGCSYGCDTAISQMPDKFDKLRRVLDRERRSNTQNTQGQMNFKSFVDQNNSESLKGQREVINETAVAGKYVSGSPEYDDKSTPANSSKEIDWSCDCVNDLADVWFWAVSAVHILGSVIAIVFHSFLIYGIVTRKYTVICTWTIYSWIYWIYLFVVSLIGLVILSANTDTNNVHLLIRFFITVFVLSLMMYFIIVVNSHRVALKHSKRNFKRATKICYSPSSSSTTAEDSVVEFYA